MKPINDNSPIRRVLTSFAWVLLLFIVLSASAIYVINSLSQHLDEVVVEKNVKVKIMNNILKLARERSLTIQSMLLTQDPFEIDELLMRMSDVTSNYIKLRDQLGVLPLYGKELELFNFQHEQTLITGKLQTRVAELIVDEQYDIAKKLFYEKAIPSQDEAMNRMENFISLQQQLIHEELVESQNEIKISKITLILLAIVSFITSIMIAIWMVKRLSSEIERRNRIENELEHRVHERTEKLHYTANHDSLTSLPNRAMFTGQMELAIERAKRNKSRCALFFMDLDGFKEINDVYGHDIGDQVLVEVASILKKLIRNEDAIARLGGDEFTVLISDLKQNSDAEEIANKIIQAIGKPIKCRGNIICHIGISIGIAYFPDDAIETDMLLTRADDFMYVAKRSGKNRYATSFEE